MMKEDRPQRGEARSAILEVADRLFYQMGIGAVAVDLVAAEVGVTKRTVYYHFPTKRDLVRAYLETRDERTRQWIGQEAEKVGKLPGDHILAVFDLLGHWFGTKEYRGCPYLNSIAEMGNDLELVQEAVLRHKNAVAGWLTDKLKQADAKDAPQLAGQLMLLVDGALIRALIYRDGTIAPQAKTAAETILQCAGIPVSRKTPVRTKRSS